MGNWSVDQCIKRFEEFCKEAFVPRELTGVPILKTLASKYRGSAYKTQPFERALKKLPTEKPLFGSASLQYKMATKVAVTSATAGEQQPVVFTHYNRPDQSTKMD